MTKVTRPRLQQTYQRTELYDLLDELSATPFIVVSALAGSGKSTLLSSYVENRDIPCLWYRVGREDVDLTTFFYYLGIAVLRMNPYKKSSLPQVSPERVLRVPLLAKAYFHKLYQCIEAPFMIVLDNYHELPKDAVLHEVIAEACAALPPGGRIVLINNGECGTTLPNVQFGRTTAVLSGEELRLSPDEVKGVAALYGVTLPSDHAAKQLHGKVDGWVSGLVNELHGELPSQSEVNRATAAGSDEQKTDACR
ncbi:MAG: hypothetical protein P8173_12315 [Gammaproteobacteria bacterium]